MDSEGNVIKALKGAKEEKEPATPEMAYFRGRLAPKNVPARAGLNRFEWDMRYPDTRGIKGGTHLHGGNLRGPVAVPGTYQVKLTVGGESVTKSLEIKMDPRISVVQENLQEKFDFLMKIRDRMSETHNAINQIFKLESELKMIKKKVKGLESEKSISAEADNIKEKLVAVKNELFAPRVRASLDFNFVLFTPLTWRDSLKLNNRLANVKSVVEGAETKPADQCYENFKELSAKLDVQLAKFKEILEKDIPAFNSLISELGVPAVPVK
jgi:hypothetical protein